MLKRSKAKMNRENESNRRRFDFIMPVRMVNPSFLINISYLDSWCTMFFFVALHCKLWTT